VGSAALFSRLSGNTQRNIRKAEREGCAVAGSDSREALRAFERLNCLTRRRHGLPPQPAAFFAAVHRHLLSQSRGQVFLATYRGRAVAGAVFLHIGRKAFYKYGASDENYQQLRPNNLAMWEALRWYADRGYETLCLGRTEWENHGLRRFKLGWGAEERIIEYLRYDFRLKQFVQHCSAIEGAHNAIFRKMPIVLLRAVGRVLYRHMG
jgi:lipid II:glycine glycyltransferase (peptidoglycan interpeptide bridge formation enzyme)